jgi:hypothetical protein
MGLGVFLFETWFVGLFRVGSFTVFYLGSRYVKKCIMKGEKKAPKMGYRPANPKTPMESIFIPQRCLESKDLFLST